MADAAQEQALETVSVVIPTHNRAQTLPRTLESVWEQRYRPIELILVDDGSTDAKAEVVSDWAAQHEDAQDFVVRSLYQENAGANAARNQGIRAATGGSGWLRLSDRLSSRAPCGDGRAHWGACRVQGIE